MPSGTRISDGSFSFESGVNSSCVTTIKSQVTPLGIARNQLPWLTNGTVRGGGISQRLGWKPLITNVASHLLDNYGITQPIYQGGWMYVPAYENPYLVLSLSGHIYKVLLESPYTVTELINTGPYSGTNPQFNPPLEPQGHFCQGEEFLIIQAGDITATVPTLPLFWDGTTLRRSVGIIGPNNVPGTAPNGQTPFNEIPAATCMDYFMNRLWYAFGRQYMAGDIVASQASGTAPYEYRDSILKVTENPIGIGGDGFIVPTNAGNIRALAHSATLDAQLTPASLYVYTRKSVYKLTVPITRLDWIGADTNNQPQQTIAQETNGSVGDRCIVKVNGDQFYKSLEPAIRSLALSIRNNGQWGNTPISNNENRVFQFENRALLQTCSGITFENRLLMSCLPVQKACGVAFQGVIPLDFDLISTLQEKFPPAWEGMYEGLLHLQLFTGDFGGLDRAFTIIVSELDNSLQIWELSSADRFDNEVPSNPSSTNPDENKRVTWGFETPAFTWGKEYELKKLDGGELWFDKVIGTVDITIEYRNDANPCWQLWHTQQICSAKNSCENVSEPVCYPIEATPYRENYKWPIVLPKPPVPKCDFMNNRPCDVGFQFQTRITIVGWCRIRGLILYALPFDRSAFGGLTC